VSSEEEKDNLRTYNKLSQYCDIGDELVTRLAEDDKITIKQKQDIFYPMIDEIKEMAVKVLEDYVRCSKHDSTAEQWTKIKFDIDTIIEKIDIFKEKIYEFHKKT